MVDFLNHHTDGHILTLEDPVEFLYQSERCLIQQREIGQHSPSFADALRGALRQDPDVILLGELRDSETIRLALTAAETGHLVLATLHTRGAAQAIERLVDTFPAQEKDPVRNQLAGSLRAVLAQKLLPDAQGGRVALYELLVNTPAAANLIREGKTWQLPGIIQTGQQAGMQNFDQSLAGDGRRGNFRPRRSITLFEIAFENDDSRRGVNAAFVESPEAAVFKKTCTCFNGAQTLVVELHGDAKAAMDFIGELTRSGGKRLFSAIHVQR